MTTPPSKPCPSSRPCLPSGDSAGQATVNQWNPFRRIEVPAGRWDQLLHVTVVAAVIFGAIIQRAPAQESVTAKAGDAREQAVRLLIDRYFFTWSKQDIDRYGQCFLPQAAVQLVDPERGLTTIPLGPFLESQREAHRRSAKPLTETAEKVEVRFETPDVARAIVYWKLTGGERTEFGYDHFTLLNVGGKWRIANLLFYAVEPEVKP
jgi:hypothetical protein